MRRFAHTVQTADTVVAGNDFLADEALRAGASVERVHVIPTCVEPASYQIARQQGGVELVWIGSSSTLQGLERARPIWQELARAVPGLRLRLICDRVPDSFPLPVVLVPWNRETEARELAAGHIGISWIPDDLWSRGKCGLKVLQYQAAGLPVVVNPVGVHREMVREGETGFLATTASEWVLAVTRLISDARMRRRMGLLARQHVEANYSVSAWAETFVSSMTGSSRAKSRAPWKVDRAVPADERSVGLPHRARAIANQNLNQIGDR